MLLSGAARIARHREQ